MASPIYAIFKDEQGMQIKASVAIKGREGSAEGYAFEYAVAIPADKNTGQLTAVRKHDNVVLIKELDNASPVLFDACCRGKTLKSVELQWFRINDKGMEEKYFVHILSDVKVVKLRQYVLHVKDQQYDGYGHQEEVALRFKKIEMTYPDGNIKAADDWNETRSAIA
jgi:type VI secretion system secreted protein Hcp